MPFIAQLLLGVVLSAISTLAQQAFAPKPKAQKQIPGLRGQYTTGGTVPMTIVLGTYGVAGQLEYSNTWGNDGETPNAYLADVITLSDFRITEVSALWIDSKSVTLPGTGHTTQGYPIPEFATGGKDYAWYEFEDGSQSTVSAYLTGKFGADAQRPWEADMIGEGIAYAIQTARINEKLYTDFPRYMYQLQGAPVFDPRESTAAGGSGTQEWGTFSTYAFSDNPIVLALNVLMGLHDPDGNHRWGGHATLAQFDYSNLEDAMDRCDDSITLKGGGTEPRYRAGIEISVNERPADVLRDLLVAANARITFARGKYYFLVDEPASADASFTDADLLIEQPIDFTWFPNLDEAVNGAAATYLEPQRAWEERETAPYYRADLETEDGQLQREALKLRCVFSGTQAQRIIKAVVSQSRKFKRHVVCLPDTYRDYRPLQVLAWTSTEFQYSSKLFLIISRTEDEFGRIWFALQEVDPTDFDWDEETDESTLTFAAVEESAVPTQGADGFDAAGTVFVDNDGTSRRPGILVTVALDLDDVRGVLVQVVLSGSADVEFDQELPYDPDVAGIVLPRAFLPDTGYEVRGRYVPRDGSGRETDFSAWIPVTTPNVKLGEKDIGDGALSITHFADTIAAPQVVDDLADAVASEGALAVLTTDGRLYRYHSGAWTAAVPTSALTGTITSAQIADAAVIAAKLATDAVTAVKIAAGAVESAKIAVGAVTSAIIANDAVQTANIAALAVTAAEIANATVTGAKIAAATVAAGNIVSGTITATQIAAGTITATQIATNTLTSSQIAASAITATEISAGAVTTAKIAAGAVTANEIAAATITADKLVANTITARELILTDFSNLLPDNTLRDISLWTQSGMETGFLIQFMDTPAVTGFSGGGARIIRMREAATDTNADQVIGTLSSPPAAVEAGVEYAFGAWVQPNPSATGRIRMRVSWRDYANVQIGSSVQIGSDDDVSTHANVRQLTTGILTAPTGACFAVLSIIRMPVTAGGSIASNFVYVDTPFIRRAANASLIVDGTITAAKIAANTVTANEIAANTITAAQIAAGAIGATQIAASAITAGKINAGAINASNLFVSGVVITDVIAANAVTTLYTGGSDTEISANASSTYKTLATVSSVVVPSSGKVHLTFTSSGEYGNSSYVQFQILRDATVVATFYGTIIDNGSGGDARFRYQTNYVLLDSPSAGTYDYIVQVRSPQVAAGGYDATRWRYTRAVASIFKK